MRRQIINIGCIVFLQLSTQQVFSQDVAFSAPDYAQLTVNPAMAGSVNDLQANMSYRNQWKRFGGAYNSMTASAEMVFRKTKTKNDSYLAGGFDLVTDNSGTSKFNSTTLRTSLAYHLQISPYERLSVGMYLGYIGVNSSVDNARWGSQYDGVDYNSTLISGEVTPSNQKSNVDLGFGTVFSSYSDMKDKSPSFQMGFAMYHLNRPNLSPFASHDSRLPIRSAGFINLSVPLGPKNCELRPSIYLQMQNKFVYLLMGSMYSYSLNKTSKESVSAGLFYRSSGAIVTRAAYQRSNWNFGLTYELNMGGKMGVVGMRSASEVSLRYFIPTLKK